MIKKTIRRFVFMIPDGTELQKIRTFIRATDGTEYPIDREIEVTKYKEKIVEYDGTDIFEQEALSKEISGTRCMATQDFVTIIEE